MAPLYGRLKGRGKEKTATATKEITASVENWESRITLTLFESGVFVVETAPKYGSGEESYRGKVEGGRSS